MSEIKTLLIANRGEIACRVMRTARALGLRTVAVYSDADANAPHVRLADEAVHIGPSPVGESYLVIDKIIDAAKATGADAIHPGYGFLSENAAFAKACKKAKIIFVGPPEKAIEVMGDKARSKRAMLKADVPCVPGYQDEDQSDDTLIAAAKAIGYPVMVKAAAGGGGRGMRLVEKAKDLPAALKLARSEAENAFGSGVLIIEKAILRPRHIEVQVFADAHGNVIHLGERDCSVQRRHQKVIEEAPCPVMTPDLRAAMGAAAVEAARAVNYRGAGTVEFLLGDDGAFYFLEMNTRLQVEHPVTEEVTGLDLVALQIAVAQGEALPLGQDDLALTGHAIEVRLYAEDPCADFLPSTGPVTLWSVPSGPGIRVDDGIATAGEVSPYYDAMVAKIIARGETRDAARRRLVAALRSTALFGLANNRDFLIDALEQSDFVSGAATTAFIAEAYGDDGFSADEPTLTGMSPAIAIGQALARQASRAAAPAVAAELMDWSSTHNLESSAIYSAGDERVTVRVTASDNVYHLQAGETTVTVAIEALNKTTARLRVNEARQDVIFHAEPDGAIHIATGDRTLVVRNHSLALETAGDEGGGGLVTAPMHGNLLDILVAEGDQVAKGDTLAVLEAMKMQHEILAEVDGVVASVPASAGMQIAVDDLILEITPDDGA